MINKMTEIEKTKKEIEVLQAKLTLLEEIEKHKSPVEEAFKDWLGHYPPTTPSVDSLDDIRWRAFQMGYNAAYDEKVSESSQESEQDYWDYRKEKETKRLQEKNWSYKVTDECGETNPYKQYFNSLDKEEYPYKKYTPEETEESLRKTFREAVKQGVISSVDKPKLDSLYDLIADWWDEIFTNGNPSGQNIESLVEQIMKLIPPSLDEICGIDEYNRGWTKGYNYYRATLLEGFNGK